MKRKSFLLLLAVLFALNGCSLADYPKARNGLLDLRNSSSVAPLMGEWLVSENGQTYPGRTSLRGWLRNGSEAFSSTWSLNVLLPAPGDYLLVLPFPREISAVSIGGTPRWTSAADTSDSHSQVIVPFRGETSSNIQVEVPQGKRSPKDPSLALNPYLLGTAEAIKSYQNSMANLAGIKLGAFGGGALVMLMLFLVGRHRKEHLAMAGYMAGAALFYIIKDSSFLGFFSASSMVLDQLYVSALSLQHLAFLALALTMLPELPRGAFRIVSLAISFLLVLAPFIPGLPLDIVYVVAFSWGFLLSLSLAIYIGYRLARGNPNLLFFLALLTLSATYVARWIGEDSLLTASVLEPAGVGVFALLTIATLVRRVGTVFDEADALSDYVANVATTVRRFIPTEFMEYLQKSDITDLRLGDHVKKEMTIFFSDIRAFTQLSEDLTPEENFAFINSYLSRMVPLIKARGGFVDKYVGDAIMALFPDTGGADQALRTALEMQKSLVEYNRHRASVGYRPIEMGIGIHTGTLMLGVVGVQDRMENTVISDAVNLSSRLQSIAKAFNIGVVISEQSFKSLEDAGLFKYRFIGKVRVKGKAAPVSCFEIFDETQEAAFELKMKANTFFEQGMLSYYQKDFLDAIYYFKRAMEILPKDGAARFYLETCLRKSK